MNAQEIKDYEEIVHEANRELMKLKPGYIRGKRIAIASAIGVGALAYVVALRIVDNSVSEKNRKRVSKFHIKLGELVYKNQTKEE